MGFVKRIFAQFKWIEINIKMNRLYIRNPRKINLPDLIDKRTVSLHDVCGIILTQFSFSVNRIHSFFILFSVSQYLTESNKIFKPSQLCD